MIEAALLDEAKFDDMQRELLHTTWELLNAIHTGDAATYQRLCVPELTCFEDVCPYRIDGVEFHLTMIRQMAQNPVLAPTRFDLLTPHVQVYGDTAIVTYTRLMSYDNAGTPRWTTFNETRIFARQEGTWKMAHFHRSPT